MNSYIWGITAVIVSTALAVLGMLAVRRKVGVDTLYTYHEVAGHLLSVVGTLYAVLLGFIIVEAMQHMQDLRVLAEAEASAVADIYLVAHGLPEQPRTRIRKICSEYVDAVLTQEWKEMEKGAYSPAAFRGAWGLWKEITEYNPTGPKEEAILQTLIEDIGDMTEKRRTRLVSASHGLQPVMWYVLIVGGLFTVLFTYFFAVTSLRAQVLMTALVAMTLSLNLFVLALLSSPFSGDLAVRPDAFRLDVMIFRHFESGTIPPQYELRKQW